jgi:hypothetical protein
MNDPITPAAPAASAPAVPAAAPDQAGSPLLVAQASPQATPAASSSPPPLVGQTPAAPQAAAGGNPFESRFGSFLDAEGNFNDGTGDYLKNLGFDQGRIERMNRQGTVDNVFKALGHAQDLLERRDGDREYIPDPAKETEFNQWRDQKGIPRDPLDPTNGYNFRSGLPEGEDFILPKDTLSEVGKMLHGSNIPKEQANALIAKVNEALSTHANGTKESFESDTRAREQSSYDDFKAKHGFEFDAKEKMLGQSAKAYEFDYNDPLDRAALTNPKVMAMMVDNAQLSRTTASMPDDNTTTSSVPPQQQIEQIMKDHPNGAWKRDTALRGRVNALLKQANAINKR